MTLDDKIFKILADYRFSPLWLNDHFECLDSDVAELVPKPRDDIITRIFEI